MIRAASRRAWLVAALALAAGGAAVVMPSTSDAAVPRIPFDPPVSDQRAVGLLRAAYDAGRTLSYAGTAFVGVGGSYVKVRLRHVPGRGTYVWPEDAPAGESMLQPDVREKAKDDPLAMLREHYQLILGGTSTVAGRSVVEVRANRPGGSLAATFSIDRGSGLVLARSAYDQTGRPYEQVMFIDLSVGASTSQLGDSTVLGHGPLLADAVGGGLGSPESQARSLAGELRAQGWHVDTSLPGGFELYDARLGGRGERAVLHLSYSDGLSSLSVFEERGVLRAESLAGWQPVTLPGAASRRTVYADGSSPQRLAWQGGDTVYALLADTAPARVANVVASLPYGAPSNSVLDRFRRGFDRLGSWVDPFR